MYRFLVPLIISSVFASTVIACPTCIGTIEYDSPKFFSNDAYRSKHSAQNNQIAHVNASTVVEKEEE